MRSLSRWFLYLLSIGILLLPMNVYAQAPASGSPGSGGLLRRELKPMGQMQGETFSVRAKLRELRLQETRRPRDIQASPDQNMGTPGRARPDPFTLLNMERSKLSVLQGVGLGVSGSPSKFSLPRYQRATGPMSMILGIQSMDPMMDTIKKVESNMEWWEMNERSRSQRGGGFRTRFGSRQPTQMMQQQGGGGTIGPPGAGGAGGFTPTPGQSMPPGGGNTTGGSFTPTSGENISSGGGFSPNPRKNMPAGGGGGGMR